MEPDLYVLASVVQNWIFYQGDRSFVLHIKHWWIAFFSDEFLHQSRKPDPLCCCRRSGKYSTSQEDKVTTFCLVDCSRSRRLRRSKSSRWFSYDHQRHRPFHYHCSRPAQASPFLSLRSIEEVSKIIAIDFLTLPPAQYLFEVHSLLLDVALRHQTGLVLHNFSLFVALQFEDPFEPYGSVS